nr:hypothetical protein [Microbispora cellulosiformans]
MSGAGAGRSFTYARTFQLRSGVVCDLAYTPPAWARRLLALLRRR